MRFSSPRPGRCTALWTGPLLVHLPGTRAGIAAVGDCLASGVSVESSGVLSPERYAEALDAHIAGLARALTCGVSLRGLLSAVSSPLGLLDAWANAAVGRRGGKAAERLRDTAGISTARLLHGLREQRLASEWWRVLRAAEAGPPLLIWREAGPEHIAGVVGWNTAHVLSYATLHAVAEGEGPQGDTLLGDTDDAWRTLQSIGELAGNQAVLREEGWRKGGR